MHYLPNLDSNNPALFRILHIDNLPHILGAGKVTCPNHPEANPDYINIGNGTIIGRRSSRPALIDPQGTLHDYVPFYFRYKSPMLYQIERPLPDFEGYRGSIQDIIYLCARLRRVQELGCKVIFTKRNASIARSYVDWTSDTHDLDWNAIRSVNWQDRNVKEHAMAEALVYNEVPIEAIGAICTYDETSAMKAQHYLEQSSVKIRITPQPSFYFTA